MSDEINLIDDICEDILSGDGLIGVQHPFIYTNQQEVIVYPYERENKNSMAYVDLKQQFENEYFVDSFFGGNTFEMLHLLLTCDEYMRRDNHMLNGYVAKQGDESYLNRFK